MDKEILVQYADMIEEIKDIRRRIEKLRKETEKMKKEVVGDSVKGTRRDGTYGVIKIEGIAVPEYDRKMAAKCRLERLLDLKEAELLEFTCQVEEYIETIPKSELRIMFRLYYIDSLPWWKVAQQMNRMFPNRRIAYTEESCKKRNLRFFENVSQCPEEKC